MGTHFVTAKRLPSERKKAQEALMILTEMANDVIPRRGGGLFYVPSQQVGMV
jgi:hypothetical protein